MKKLLFWAALLTTGFAFYSCDDVVDNPVQDENAQWNYSVSVTCPDFTGLFDENNDPVTYQVPKTLYVLNEQGQELGTISTPTAPAVNTAATYEGTLKGVLGGENLILTTNAASNFIKQDGTITSAIKNGIVQTAKVPIKIYNANSKKVTTGAAKLENLTSIAIFRLNGLVSKDEKEFTFSSKNFAIPGVEGNSFKITLDKAVDATKPFYVAIGVNTDKEFDIQIDTDVPEKGYALTGDIKDIKGWKTGLVYGFGWTDMEANSVDLTKYWAAYKAKNENATNHYFDANRKGIIISQSGSENLPLAIYIHNDATLKSVNVQHIGVYTHNSSEITLEGKNTVDYDKSINIADQALIVDYSTATFTGKGSLDLYGKNYGFNVGNGQYTDSEGNNVYPKMIIDKGVSVTSKAKNYRGAYIYNYGTLELAGEGTDLNASGPQGGVEVGDYASFVIGDKATVVASAEDADQSSNSYDGIRLYGSKLTIGEEASVTATSKCRSGSGIYCDYNRGTIIIGKKATITATGGNVGKGIYSWGKLTIDDEATIDASAGRSGRGIEIYGNDELNIGKSVTIKADGSERTTDYYSYGLVLATYGDINIGDNTNITASSNNGYYSLYIYRTSTLTLGKGATINATMTGEEDGKALYISVPTIKGKGSIKAESKNQQYGAYISNLNLEGGSLEAIGGSTAYGMYIGGTLTLNKTFTQLKVTSGQTTDPICIYKSATGKEATLAELIGGGAEADFVDSGVKDGVRTITPKPAEE